MSRNGGSKASGNSSNAKKIAAQIRVRKALQLRMAGATFQAIADQCGYKNAQRAHEAVKRAIKAIPRQEATEIKQMEADRLDRLMLAIWERATKGDTEATDRILKIMKRRADLLGLDAPAKHELGGLGGGAIPILTVESVPPDDPPDDIAGPADAETDPDRSL